MMRKSVLVLLVASLAVFGFGESAKAAIDLPWSTTYDYGEWEWSPSNYHPPNYPEMDRTLDTSCGGHGEQFTTAANMIAGGGGRGQRHWVGDGTNNNSGGINVVFTPTPEIWIRWYMRYESGFAWDALNYDKILFLHTDGGSDAIPEWKNINDFCIYNQATGDDHNNLWTGEGWQTVMGGDTSDGQWHCYEIYLKMDTNGTNGECRLWIDGDPKGTLTGIKWSGNDTTTGWNYVGIGSNQATPDNGHAMAVDFDDIAISNTGYIGPIDTAGMPLLSSTSQDTISHKDSVTISGSGFGATGPTIYMWDDFEDGIDSRWAYNNDSLFINSDNSRSNSDYCIKAHRGGGSYAGSLRYDLGSFALKDGGELFASIWRYWDPFPTSHEINQKIFRLWPRHIGGYTDWVASYNEFVAPYPSQPNTLVSLAEGGDMSPTYFSMPAAMDWSKFDIYIRKSTAPGVSDGIARIWKDGVLYVNQTGITHYTSEPEQDWLTWIFDNYGNALDSDNVYSYMDDAYIDSTQARIEICNESEWNESRVRHCEIQIPQSWNDTSITFTTNQGSFPNGTAHLFVVDENGTVSDGYPITFSVGGHKADLNDDGVINMKELISFIARWKTGDGVSKTEVLDTREIWFVGGVY